MDKEIWKNRWRAMKNRCENPTNARYSDYGGRGISVSEEWQNFENYYNWCLVRYKPGLELDRIDNQGNYSPDNCHFATRSQNQRNTRKNKDIQAFGDSMCVADWSEDPRCLIDRKNLEQRLQRGWDPEEALTAPMDSTRKGRVAHNANDLTAWGETKPTTEWLKDDRCVNKEPKIIWQRMKTQKWSAEKAMGTPIRKCKPRAK